MEKYLRFQASVFGDFKDIDLSQESMSKLYQIYLKENMMPTIMKEFDVVAQNVKNRPNFLKFFKSAFPECHILKRG